jgi:uncharacterized protein YbdZ (MbtH family)
MSHTAGRAILAVAAVAVLAGCRSPAPHAADFADDTSPAELVRIVESMLPAIERLSGLDRTATLRMRYQSRDAARQYVEQRLHAEMPPERLDGVRRTYVALGLVPDTLDLQQLLLDLYTEQVLGYYDPGSETLYIIEGEDADALRPVIAHELVHALQDQHTNLDSIIAAERGNDRQTAAHAAMEGHAMIVMFAVLSEAATRRRIDPAALPNPSDELGPALAAQNELYPVFRRAPAIVRETLLFPYIHGASFVHELWRSMQPMERYPAPIDTLLPQSTTQVLHPRERFISERRAPVEIGFTALPAGWRSVEENTFGQLETSIFLAQHLGDSARAMAEGWAGDRFVLLSDGVADVLHWISIWEDDAVADRFADAAARAAAVRSDRRVVLRREDAAGRPAVRIIDAPADVTAVPPVPAYEVRTP